MKNNFIKIFSCAVIFLLLSGSMESNAGSPVFRQLKSVKLPFTPSEHFYSHTGDFKYFLCSTKTDMLMLDGITGAILWQKNFEKDFNNKKFSNQHWNMAANVILVFDEDTKKGIATKYFIDGNTGKLLWESDQYVSDYGKYELGDGFSFYYNYETNGVLLPTKESVDMVDVSTGKTLWSKNFQLSGKARQFDCFLMEYHNLVKVIPGKDEELYLTVTEGAEVSDIDNYFDKKKFMGDRLHASIIDIPDKEMYVLMQGETNKFFRFIGMGSLPKWKMTFRGYDANSDELVWTKQYKIAYSFDYSTNEPYVKLFYSDGKLFVEHDPNINNHSGLTVLDPETGDFMWETQFTTSESKNGLKRRVTTPFPAPDPVGMNNKTYVVNKDNNRVVCLNSENGDLIWESEKFPDAQKIPNLFVTEDVVILSLGGDALKFVQTSQSNGPTIYSHEYNNKDKYGIIAYDPQTGREVWSDKTIAKDAKDSFSFIAGLELIDDKLFCSTGKNFFILEPTSGKVINSIPVSAEKVGSAWKMNYFEKEQKVILNCKSGIIKIDPIAAKIAGVVKTPTIPYFSASYAMNADDLYNDYAVFTKGNVKKNKIKQFASIDLDKMTVRGVENSSIILSDYDQFSEGAEMFFTFKGGVINFFSVK